MSARAFGHESHQCPTCGKQHVGEWGAICQGDVVNVLKRTGKVRLWDNVALNGWAPPVAVNITRDEDTTVYDVAFEVTAPDTDEEGIVAFARLVLEAVKGAHREFEVRPDLLPSAIGGEAEG